MDELARRMDAWFKGSLRMPFAVACDRISVLDWVDYEAEAILAEGLAPDRETAERRAADRLLQNPKLLRALVPELHRARPGPIRRNMALAALLEALGWGCFALVLLEIAALYTGLGFVAFTAAARLLLHGAAEKILRLRRHCREIWTSLIGILGCFGYLIYTLTAYLPDCRRQRAALAAAKKAEKTSDTGKKVLASPRPV